MECDLQMSACKILWVFRSCVEQRASRRNRRNGRKAESITREQRVLPSRKCMFLLLPTWDPSELHDSVEFFPPVDPAHSPEAGSLGLWYLAFWVGSRLVRESISISRVDASRLPSLQTFLRPPPPTTDTCAATYMWIHIPQKCTHTCTHAHCKTHQVAGTCMIKVPIFCDLTNSTCLCKGPWRPVPIHIRLDSNPH